MMDAKQRTRASKLLSLILRHEPESAGLTLEPGGWVLVTDLLDGLRKMGKPISLDDLKEIVATSDKKRFAFDDSGAKIRANQGHSAEVDLQLEPRTPPAILYHGTSEAALPSILVQGVLKQSRHHVHLSTTPEQAYTVGQRHGRPVVLAVDAGGMHAAGFTFLMSDNGVWLVDEVPPPYLRRL
jgi:putative RNA 2'-phosphotransferase